jgi:alginate O-acetyltransferase complex protein AlgI
VLWGLYYGVLIALERLFFRRVLERLPRVVQHGVLLFLVMVGWALFYFTDFSRLTTFFSLAFGSLGAPLWNAEVASRISSHAFWLVLVVVCCLPLGPGRGWLRRAVQRAPASVDVLQGLATVALTLLATAMLVGKSYNPFLYFRF